MMPLDQQDVTVEIIDETPSGSLYGLAAAGAGPTGLCLALPPAGIWLAGPAQPAAGAWRAPDDAHRLVSRALERESRRRSWPARGYFSQVKPPDATASAISLHLGASDDRATPGLAEPLWFVPFRGRRPGTAGADEPPRAVALAAGDALAALRARLDSGGDGSVHPLAAAYRTMLAPVSVRVMSPVTSDPGWVTEYRCVVLRPGTVAAALERQGRFSRTLWRAISRHGYVLHNGVPAMPGDQVAAGDNLWVLVPSAAAPTVPPEKGPLKVVYEDRDLLIVDKPAAMLAHPARGKEGGTLANLVVAHLLRNGGELVPRPVGRLDRGTSGLMVFARTRFAHQALARQRRQGGFERSYLAITAPSARRLRSEFVVDAPVASPPSDPGRYVLPRQARTRVRVLARRAGAWLVEARPETGRTHQVRQHLALKGIPLYGDSLYGGPVPAGRYGAGAGCRRGGADPARPALHAWRLAFAHPVDGQAVRLRSPLPADMRRLLGVAAAAGPPPPPPKEEVH